MFAIVTPEYFLPDGTRINVPNLDGSETIAAYCGGSTAAGVLRGRWQRG